MVRPLACLAIVLLLTPAASGQLQFDAAPDVPLTGVPAFPRAPLVADFDGNGLGDVVVGRENPDAVSLYLGVGAGTFILGETIDLPETPLNHSAGDFDGNGALDLVISALDVRVYLADGIGNFNPGQVITPAVDAGFLTTTDINADGFLDLIVSLSDEIHVHLGDGTGSFGAPIASPIEDPRMIHPVDVNADGILDAIVSTDGGIAVLTGDGSGALNVIDTEDAAGLTFGSAIGDIDGDGLIDAAVTTSMGEVRLFYGEAGGTLGPLTTFPVIGAVGVDLVDYDEDGWLDLGLGSGGALEVALGDGQGGFAPPLEFPAPVSFPSLVSEDLDGDGHLDAVLTGLLEGHFTPLLNTTIFPANFIRGDSDGDGSFVVLADAVFLLLFQFVPGSPAPPCMDAVDADDDGSFSGLVDALVLLNFGFNPGSPPPAGPFPDCGTDPTADALTCDASTCSP